MENTSKNIKFPKFIKVIFQIKTASKLIYILFQLKFICATDAGQKFKPVDKIFISHRYRLLRLVYPQLLNVQIPLLLKINFSLKNNSI